MSDALLAVRDLHKHFAGVTAIDGIDLDVFAGEILACIGPNGSGKTTLFNLLSGFLRPSKGSVTFSGRRIEGLPPHRIVHMGMARTFQQAMSFPQLTVAENIMVPLVARGDRQGGQEERLLELCDLAAVRHVTATALPYGLQRKLGIAIALATHPHLLLLDEPAAGLGDEASRDLGQLIRAIRGSGVTVVVIDHDMPFVLPISDRVVVLDAGKKLFEGTADQVRAHDRVIEVYLGHELD